MNSARRGSHKIVYAMWINRYRSRSSQNLKLDRNPYDASYAAASVVFEARRASIVTRITRGRLSRIFLNIFGRPDNISDEFMATQGKVWGHVARTVHQCGEIYYLAVRETDYRSRLIQNLWFSLFAPHSVPNRNFSSWYTLLHPDKAGRSYLELPAWKTSPHSFNFNFN